MAENIFLAPSRGKYKRIDQKCVAKGCKELRYRGRYCKKHRNQIAKEKRKARQKNEFKIF